MYLVMGLGASSKAIITKFKELKKEFIVLVKKEECKEASEYHDNVLCYEMIKYIDLKRIKYVIKSPGIPYYNQYVKYFKNNHIKVINEIELVYLLTNKIAKYIGVSGSVGKSSTVSLLYHLIKAKTDNVILAGNIGIPLINYIDKINENTIIILEVSSFQLDDFNKMRFNISLLLNIYDNHLDFYKRKELYYLSKFKLTNNQTRNNYFLVNLDNNITKKYLLNHCFKSTLIDYKSGFELINNYLYYYKRNLLRLDDYSLIGNHNLDNLKAVITILNLLNIDLDVKALRRFESLKYHLQETKIKELLIVNDSKSTSTSSLKAAIETYKHRRIILLFGGYNKNLDFSFLTDYSFKYSICFGKLSKEIDKKVNYDIKFDTLKEATNFAFKIASRDDVVLFSPGCASFDEFDGYLSRGKAFDTYIREYYNEEIK